ncbi:MAG: hypothetical protein ACN6PR_20560 [Achromobacter sp.]
MRSIIRHGLRYHYARQHTSPQQAWLRDQIREVLQERAGAPAAQPA